MDYLMKTGDVKISTEDLTRFLGIIERYQPVVFNNLDVVDEEEQKVLIGELDVYNNFITKYVIASDLRRKESLWFGVAKMINTQNYFKVKQEDVKETSKAMSLEDYIYSIKGMLNVAQELPKGIDMLVGLAVSVHGFDAVKRAVWGEYIGVKIERENAVALKG